MGKLVLIGAGAVLGVLGARRARSLARSYGPAGVSGRAASWWEAAKDFAADVGEGMTEREAQLRAALGVDADAAQLDPGEAAELLERPTSPRP